MERKTKGTMWKRIKTVLETGVAPLHSISSVIGGRLEHEWKVDKNQLFFNFLSMSTQLWAALININSYQLNCKMLLSISMSTSIVPILAYQLFLINALNISGVYTHYGFEWYLGFYLYSS